MKQIKTFLSISVLVMFAVLFSFTTSAANYNYNISAGDIVFSAGTGANAGKIAVNQGTIRYITPSDTINISGSTTTNTIIVEPGVSGVKIILSGVSIDVSALGNDHPNTSESAFDIGDGASVDVTLSAGTTNTFKSGYTKAGIKVEKPSSGTAGSITINGTGTLTVVGGSGGPEDWYAGSGAGIGSNGIIYGASSIPSGGNITINNGTIYATGGTGTNYSGAGIGGGGGAGNNAPNAGSITIHGGIVTATGGSSQFSGAGIGGGSGYCSGTMGTVFIDGGSVTAKSGDGTYIASGIGYGYPLANNLVRTDAASITITGTAVVNASTPNGKRVYAAIGHNDKGSLTISGTATVTATKGISTDIADCGTISCNNLVISDSPSITVYSPDKQGDQGRLGNGTWPRDAVKPIYAKSISSSVPIMAGIFSSPPKITSIILTGGEPSSSKTITLPENYASFAVTVTSTGPYSGAMGIDVLQDTATLSQTFNLTNSVSTYNVKQLDITPPTAPGGLTAAVGPVINSQEEAAGVQVVLSLGSSGALINDAAELLLDGLPFSTPVKHVLNSAEITASSCTITIPAARLGEDGSKVISARIIDEAGNVGPAGESLTLLLDTTAPTPPADVQVYPIGGTVNTNTLNLTNTNLTASALINATEAAGGRAELYIDGVLKASDNTILPEDTQATFDLGQSTTTGIQAAVETGGVVTVALYDAAGNKSISLLNPTLAVDYTVPSVDAVDVPTPALYKAGNNLDFTVNFNENVLVSGGTPYIQIALDTGGTVNAAYFSGSGTSALIFRYTVSAGDYDANGVQVVSGAVDLNGGLISDLAGNNADLTLLNVGSTESILVDTIAPYVVSVGVPADHTYGSNLNLDFIVNFNEEVSVANGIPALSVTLDTGGTVNADYLSGSGSSALVFRYTIISGNLDSDGIEIGSDIVLTGSSIQDAAGNDAVLELVGVGSTSEVKIDAVLPVIDSASIASNNKYIDITFSKGVFGTGALTADKLALIFTRNSGNATNATISSIKSNDSEVEDSASALTGGELSVRVFIDITGTPSGLETVKIGPATASSVYDVFGNAMAADEATEAIALNDQIPPTAGALGTITASDAASSSVHLAWSAATDQKTAAPDLQYRVVYSLSDNISTVTEAQSNGTVAKNWTASITETTVTGLNASTDYYFNVLVKDEAGNITAYTTATMTTSDAAVFVTHITVTGTGGATSVQVGSTLQMQADVLPANVTDNSVTWSIETGSGATIDTSGLLTASAEGSVTVRATANDGSNVYGERVITVTAVPVTTYTVTFISNGTVYTTKTVNAGQSIGSAGWPAAPQRSSYTFGGWFTSENGAGTQFTAETPVYAATAVYAKWTYSGGGGSTTPSTPTYQSTVSAGNGSSLTLPVTVDKNSSTAYVDVGSENNLMFEGKSTVITVPAVPDIDTYVLGIPVLSLSTRDEQGTITFKTAVGTVTVPSNMLTDAAGIGGIKAEISIGQGNSEDLPGDLKSAVGNRPLISLSLLIDGKQIDWSNPNAPVFVSIPYTPTAEELANPEGIVIWYIDGSGKAVSVPDGHYDAATGTVTFSAVHFSDYAVVYNKLRFNDVSETAWFSDAVGFIAARGITTGTGNGNFSPNAKLTRGEFIVMLMRAYSIAPDENPTENFSDAGSTFYTGYLAAAKRLGISVGVGSNMFNPGKEITRQEMFALLYNALKVIGRLPEGTGGNDLTAFSDADTVASWATDALTFLVKTGTVGGSGGKLSPTATATRAEMAQVLYSLLGINTAN